MKEIAELKEYLVNKSKELRNKILQYQNELTIIENSMKKVDELLSSHSFTPAKDLYNAMRKNGTTFKEQDEIEKSLDTKKSELIVFEDKILGNINLDDKFLEIIISDRLEMTGEEPPFKSFFINKIMDELITEDEKLLENNEIKKEDMISISLDKSSENNLYKFVISNYRTKTRKDRIIKAISWAFRTIFQKK